MLNLFDGESDTPELIWDGSMRGELREAAGLELDSCIKLRRDTGRGDENFCLKAGLRVKYAKLENELLVGGVYVARFLKEPTFNMRDPTSFLEALLLRWTHELQICTENESNGEEKISTDIIVGGQDNLQPVTDAIVYLCKVRTNLCDKLAQWGYMSRCLVFLENTLAHDLLGSPLLSIIRILHVAANRRVNVESIIASGTNDSVHGIIAFTIRAVGDTRVHPDAGFMLEMLKKVFVDALGDVQKAAELKKASSTMRPATYLPGNSTYAMAPSPAPGEDQVSRNRVRVNMGDDPLGLGAGISPPPAQMMSQQNVPYMNTSQSYGQMQTGISNVTGQPRNQMAYSHSQSYNNGLQQPQQASYGQTTYVNPPHSTEMRQSYPTPQPVQSSNSYRSHTGQHMMQQQPPQTTGINPYASDNTNANQTVYTSYGKNNQFSQAQQHNAPTPSNEMLLSQGMESSYGVNTRSRSNMTYQTNISSNQMHTNQNAPVPHGLQTTQYQNTPAAQKPFQGKQIQSPQLAMSAGIAPNAISAPISHIQNVAYQPTLTGAPIQQNRNSLSNANNSTQQYNNNIQSTNPNHVAVNQQYQQPLTSHLDPKKRGYQEPNQPTTTKIPNVYRVETVTDVDQQGVPASQFSPPPQFGQPVAQTASSNEGGGIDARTQYEPPSVQAAKAAETVQGAPNCADGRKVLLESALRCDLPKYLIESVLENSALPKVKDAASVKVHAIELLKLLTQDPGYGLKFKLVLETIPAWKKYASQDHSLFITGLEQKADYFLTDGSSSLETKKLLTNN